MATSGAAPASCEWQINASLGTGAIPTSGGTVVSVSRRRLISGTLATALNGQKLSYRLIHESQNEWENARGLYSSGSNTIARATGTPAEDFEASSTGSPLVNFSAAGLKRCMITFNGNDLTALINAVGNDPIALLGLTAGGSYSQTQSQAIINKIDQIIDTLRLAGIILP